MSQNKLLPLREQITKIFTHKKKKPIVQHIDKNSPNFIKYEHTLAYVMQYVIFNVISKYDVQKHEKTIKY